MHDTKIDGDTATLALAAAICDRAAELIDDGWVKGALKTHVEGTRVPHKFCILGAIDQAMEEIYGLHGSHNAAREVAQAFILDEALAQFRHNHGSIPGFNDAGNRRQGDVVSVVSKAGARLWDLSLELHEDGRSSSSTIDYVDLTQYADMGVDGEATHNYLHAVLA